MKKLISIADDDTISENSSDLKSKQGSNISLDNDQEDDGDIISVSEFKSNDMQRYKSLDRFFRNLDIKKKQLMVDIINKNSEISLRILDKFVTKYASKSNIMYKINKQDDDDDFNVHISYKAQLKSYKKRFFDPFRRGTKFNYQYDKDDTTKKTLTTLGQLNFFRWVFVNKIIDYVEIHKDDIIKTICKWDKEALGKKKQADKKSAKPKVMQQIKKYYIIEDIKKQDNKIILTFD
jgi:hypothetical protein